MSELALNLVALAVFLMTMSALLGPLVHLSPAVTAIAIAALLGLATLDSFSWQGKGAVLLLDWIARFSPKYRDRVIHHEAGHFLVAHCLGIPVTGYTLSAWEAFKQGQAGQGGIQVDSPIWTSNAQPNFSSVQRDASQPEHMGQLEQAKQLDHYCTIWMAGVAAESLVYQTVQGGEDDYQKMRSLLSQLPLSPQERQQKERWAALRAKTILQDHWPAYEALVAAMTHRASVIECCQILEPDPSDFRPITEEHAKVIKVVV
jgi:hypothetical protein